MIEASGVCIVYRSVHLLGEIQLVILLVENALLLLFQLGWHVSAPAATKTVFFYVVFVLS